ncbi:BamA/TamA family outer membrane protein [Pleomorphovibrio marinus]|uniref:BamA/TamA family outer membrane protein n=1 Tax=Pleomorphovibrio marinus TaxID=2164132 RepID=UPI001E44161E|nr:BamA/TamA family outer membrane protein [Pleomorphovibrio marinus]
MCLFNFLSIWCVLGQEEYRLRYAVTGEQTRVEELVFEDSLSRDQQVKSLLLDLQGQGYLLAQVIHSDFSEEGVMELTIQTRQMFEWVSLGQGNVEDWLVLKSGIDLRFFQHKPINFRVLQRSFDRLLSTAENHGFPFANIKLDSLYLEKDNLGADMWMDLGPHITFDTLQVLGGSRTKPMFLAKSLDLVPGEPFSQKKVENALQALRNIPYVQLSESPSLTFQNEEATLYLPLEDRKLNTIDGIIGFLPNEIEANRMLVTGQFDLELYNVSGKGRNYQINWQRLSQYSQNLRVAATEPLVFGSRIDLHASYFLLKEDTTFLNRDFSINLGYRISGKTYLSFFNRRQAGDLLSTFRHKSAKSLPEAADFRYNNYGGRVTFSDLNDAFFPTQGWHASFNTGLGNKRLIQNTGLPNELYEGVEMVSLQYYMEADISYRHLVRGKFGALYRLRAGEMDNENLLLNDLFRVGGLKSFRGFNENFFFASRYAYLNIEPRYYFDTSSYFLIFADFGRMENQVTSSRADWPIAFGAGFSMETKGGIFNFVYAVGKAENQPIGFNYSRIHFGYTARF